MEFQHIFQCSFCKTGSSSVDSEAFGSLEAVANEDTLLLMTFPCACKLGNICCGHKMFLNKIRNIFVSQTQNLCPQQMLRARANGKHLCRQRCVRNNVSSFASTFRKHSDDFRSIHSEFLGKISEIFGLTLGFRGILADLTELSPFYNEN